MKRTILAPIAVAVMLALAGCSGAQSGAGSGSGGDVEKGATLKVLHYLTEKPKLNGLDLLIKGFNKLYPDVKIQTEATSLDQYGDTLKLRASGNSMPDILFGSPKTYGQFVKDGQIRDLTGTDAVKSIDPQYIQSTSVNSKVYGIPLSLGSGGVFYNKDIFAKAGVKVPTTWTEFVGVMKTLKAGGVTPFAAGYKDLGTFGGALYADLFGGPSAKSPNWRADVQSGKTKFSNLDFFKKSWARFGTRNQYVNADAPQVGLDQSEQMFARGDTAMVILGSWGLAPIRADNPKGNFGYFMLPTSDTASENLMQVFTDDNWMASAKSKYPNAQLAFLKYLSSKEGGQIWASAIQGVSTVKGAVADHIDPMTADIQKYIAAGTVWNSSSTDDFSGQYLDAWFKRIQEYPFNPQWQSDLNAYMAAFDGDFDHIRQTQ